MITEDPDTNNKVNSKSPLMTEDELRQQIKDITTEIWYEGKQSHPDTDNLENKLFSLLTSAITASNREAERNLALNTLDLIKTGRMEYAMLGLQKIAKLQQTTPEETQ